MRDETWCSTTLVEPTPSAGATAVLKQVFFRYPDQQTFPAGSDEFNFDAEALYTLGDRVYILTKHRSDTATTLYRLDDAEPGVVNVLTRISEFDIQGRAVAADATPDGRLVVVAAYDALWLFDVPHDSDDIFQGRIRRFPFVSEQVEAVCFIDGETLLLGDEATAELFEVSISDFTEVKPPRSQID